VLYLFGKDVDTPNVFHMLEAYAGGWHGFEGHTRTSHSHYMRWEKFKEEGMPFLRPF
jgi:hypothetical protein